MCFTTLFRRSVVACVCLTQKCECGTFHAFKLRFVAFLKRFHACVCFPCGFVAFSYVIGEFHVFTGYLATSHSHSLRGVALGRATCIETSNVSTRV